MVKKAALRLQPVLASVAWAGDHVVWLGFANPQPQNQGRLHPLLGTVPENWDFEYQARSVAGPPDQADRWEPDAAQCHSEIFMSSANNRQELSYLVVGPWG